MKVLQSFIRFGFVLVCILLLEACATTPPQTIQPTSPAVSGSSPQNVPESSPTPGPPYPTWTLLAPPPRNCPVGPALGTRAFSGFRAPAIGSGPVWEMGLPANVTLHLDDYGYTKWPGTQILWPITSDLPHKVVVRVTNLETGSESWWDIGGGAPPPALPVRPLILDGTFNQEGNPPTLGAFLYLQTGCYVMTVSWTGGQWRLFFAAGR